MNTHETYVSLETAKLMKQTGFDWDCETCYNHFGQITSLYDYAEYEECCGRPTFAVAQKWLREDEHLDVIVSRVLPIHEMEYSYQYEYTVISDDGRVEAADCYFETYEEALEAGINKCLILILEEK